MTYYVYIVVEGEIKEIMLQGMTSFSADVFGLRVFENSTAVFYAKDWICISTQVINELSPT